LRADAWKATREAELEAVVNRSYDSMDVPGIPEIVAKAAEVMAPLIAEFDRLFAEAYPAEFARATLGIRITPGGVPPGLRKQVRQDAAQHLAARHRYVVANSSGHTTQITAEATSRATDNPEVREMIERAAAPNIATPVLEPPGPAIGILAKLLPHPEEWGLAGYDDGASPLLPAPKEAEGIKSLPAPKEKRRR
jgi:hypothetical protein